MGMPSTARRAREEALKRHRREVDRWKLVAIVNFVCLCAVAGIHYYGVLSGGWHTDKPMPMQRLTVVTEGFMDKQGDWRSFDNGEKITVKQWKP